MKFSTGQNCFKKRSKFGLLLKAMVTCRISQKQENFEKPSISEHFNGRSAAYDYVLFLLNTQISYTSIGVRLLASLETNKTKHVGTLHNVVWRFDFKFIVADKNGWKKKAELSLDLRTTVD